ncbi:MAG: LysM repeat protein [Arenicella sp.]|jgi:LysM repeat protein
MKKLLSILFFLSSFCLFAQPEDATTRTIDGKKYYVHIVQLGNTLYGIQQLYSTDLKEILSANPSLSDNLTIGQEVLIPTSSDDEGHYQTHVVASGETLYGISKKYKCTVADLKSINSGIEDGISIGQKINVPKSESTNGEVIQSDPIVHKDTVDYQITYSDSIVRHKVMVHETLYSVSKRYMVSMDTIKSLNGLRNNKIKKGMVLIIPVKKVNYEVLEKEILPIVLDSNAIVLESLKKEVYNVALILPFMFAQNDIEMAKSIKFGQYREMYPTSKIAFEFYQGLKIAIDSLKKAGLTINVYAFDSKKDTATIAGLFKKKEFTNIDLVIGPLFPKTIAYTAKLCKDKGIRIVVPFKADAKVLHENPYVFKTVTSNMTLMDGAVDFLVENYPDKNIVILKPYNEVDKAMYERARDRFNAAIALAPSYNVKIIELSLGSSGGRDLSSQLKKDTANIVIIPSNDVKFVSRAMNTLNKVLNLNPYAKNMRVVAFGFEDWNKFDDIDVLHRNRLNQHFATYRFVDYNSEEILPFLRSYRAKTGVDPTVYSAQGFDIGYYFLSALHLHGTNFENKLSTHQIDLIQNEFQFREIEKGSGYENSNVQTIKYEGFELQPAVK